MKAPRVITFGGAQVYAPECPCCGSVTTTRWVKLPEVDAPRDHFATMSRVHAECSACAKGPRAEDRGCFYPDPQEAWRAREPERLERRLAELRSAS